MNTRTLRYTLLLLLALGLPLSACRRRTPTPSPPILGEALVESVDIRMLESFPVQVQVGVEGKLPDGCTTIDQVITKPRDRNNFEITLTTTRPRDAACTAGQVPFEKTIPLDVVGLKAGVYLVTVNGISNSFELSVDNVLPATPN